MPAPRPSLRTDVDRLIRRFVDAVIDAVRDELESSRPAPSRTPRAVAKPAKPATKTRAKSPTKAALVARRAPSSVASTKPRVKAAHVDPAPADDYHDVVIDDPEALLREASREAAPPPSSRAATPRTAELLAPVAPVGRVAPAVERPAAAPVAARLERTVTARAGEDVIQASGGALVLRRRRSARSSSA